MAAYPTSARLMQLLLLSCCGLVSLGASRAAAALSFDYNFSVPGDLDRQRRPQVPWLGDSIPSVDRVDITIRDKQNSSGRVFYPQPVRLWNRRTGAAAASFNTSFSFAIYNSTRYRGDGMAFFIEPFPPSLPPELLAATNNFSEDRKLGAGAFGRVYRGYLGEDSRMQQPVAVKRVTTLMEQTRRDYVTEVMTLGRISHRNLVRLVGWCDGGGSDDATKLLLVYELVMNGSLDRHLHGGPDERLLTWAERFKILLGVGYAIEYLHTGCGPNPILHRDIKPSNVMLTDDFVAKLGDFRLVRQTPTTQGYLAGTTIIGSNDYIDPVCITNNTVSTASDMYSFGVLLLEMATGKDPAVMRQSPGRPHALVETVQEHYHSGTLLKMADERLNGSYEEWQMQRVLEVGHLCVQHDRQDRPAIKDAITFLSYQQHTVPAVALSQTTTPHLVP